MIKIVRTAIVVLMEKDRAVYTIFFVALKNALIIHTVLTSTILENVLFDIINPSNYAIYCKPRYYVLQNSEPKSEDKVCPNRPNKRRKEVNSFLKQVGY